MPHPESDRLRHALERCASRAVRWSGVVYRSALPRYANKDDLLTGVGSKTAGGRWNPPKSSPTVYSSLDPHTALDEVLAHFRYYGFPIESAMPRVTVSVSARLVRVLDLTDGKIRSALRISERRILEEPWREVQKAGPEALTQALGRIVHELGWEAFLVPSAARRGG
jgi:RES domain-containing protein